ncbi:MAG: hypothetical protein F6K31_39610 [Symploca sp. SIO2G7]|nr:hypothetical protein [Symploca sp. SIO2G7]
MKIEKCRRYGECGTPYTLCKVEENYNCLSELDTIPNPHLEHRHQFPIPNSQFPILNS